MHSELEQLATVLELFSVSIIKNGHAENQLSQFPNTLPIHALKIKKFSIVPMRLANAIRASNAENLPEELLSDIKEMSDSISNFQGIFIHHITTGSGISAIIGYLLLFETTSALISQFTTWVKITDRNLLPTALLTRAQREEKALDLLIVDFDKFDIKVRSINDAFQTAEELPATLQDLKLAREQIDAILKGVRESDVHVKDADADSKAVLARISELEKEAATLVENCGQAYRAATSHGLAASFEEQEKKLNNSILWWISALIASLLAAIVISYLRFELISSALNSSDIKEQTIWIKVALSILSLGPPIWFAWLATKQIGQRFRMASDYAFKASVAKAYEGYRREAARIDPEFEARLFSSALSRVEEAPLRLVEVHSYGSPLHEFATSEAFQKFKTEFPEATDKLLSYILPNKDKKSSLKKPEPE